MESTQACKLLQRSKEIEKIWDNHAGLQPDQQGWVSALPRKAEVRDSIGAQS